VENNLLVWYSEVKVSKPTRCKEKRERIIRYSLSAEDIAICLEK